MTPILKFHTGSNGKKKGGDVYECKLNKTYHAYEYWKCMLALKINMSSLLNSLSYINLKTTSYYKDWYIHFGVKIHI